MKIGYSYAKEALIGGDFTALSSCAESISKTIALVFEKGDIKKTKELVLLVKENGVIDTCLPYSILLSKIEDYNSQDIDVIYDVLLECAERRHDHLISDYMLTHCENALFKYKEIGICEKYLKKILSIYPNNRDALELALYAHVKCTDKEMLYKSIGKLTDYSIVKRLLDFGYFYEEKVASIDFILNACYDAVTYYDEVIDFLNIPEIIGVIICFFKPEMTERFSLLYKLACKLKEAGQFEEARKIFESLLDFNYNKSACYWNIIQCKRKVRSDHDLIKYCYDFSKNIEYSLALKECEKEGIDPKIYTMVLQRVKKRKRGVIVSLIFIFIIIMIFASAIYLAYYLYSNGYDKPQLFNLLSFIKMVK